MPSFCSKQDVRTAVLFSADKRWWEGGKGGLRGRHATLAGARYLTELSGMLSVKTVPHVTVCGSLRDTQELLCAVAQSGGPDLASCVWLGSLLQAFGSDWQASQKWRVIRTQEEMELVRFTRPTF